jgi:hypothetical protein
VTPINWGGLCRLRTRSPLHQTHQFQSVDFWVSLHIIEDMPMFHPWRHHAEFEQSGSHAFDRQNIWMYHSLADDYFLAISLHQAIADQFFNLISLEGAFHLINLVDRILLIYAKRFNRVSFVVCFVCDSPDITESSTRERSLIRRLAE